MFLCNLELLNIGQPLVYKIPEEHCRGQWSYGCRNDTPVIATEKGDAKMFTTCQAKFPRSAEDEQAASVQHGTEA